MNQIFTLLNKYNRREQMMLLACALAVSVYLLWLVVLGPIQSKRDQLLAANTASTQALGRVQIMAAQIQQMRDQGTTASSANISGAIDSSLRANGLSMSGFQPGANGEVRVRLERASYESLMQWLYEMEFKQGISVSDLSITATNDVGQVTVTLRLQKR
ncbi:type II secretion system protein GspM [Cellvibrio sp. PSBB023]|uniref:type II secretion system protein GspM n=1 Tax=Cellvibrio sp. PSBB023 TaxID=1945512 RepID=UPI00098F50D4|nr:type II secretion system protein M [Cellvibrio sp. PSBB023]AQT61547.1 general secretion pathway protein GspM [Cellvibrio sp. PSBB023]